MRRMVLNYSLLQQGFPTLIIEIETKTQYIEFFENQDVDGFVQFAKTLLEKEQKRMQSFQNMYTERVKYNH